MSNLNIGTLDANLPIEVEFVSHSIALKAMDRPPRFIYATM